MTLAERFAAKWQEDENGCWIWQASIRSKGYGGFSVGRRTRPAHRVAYELLVGPIPDGLVLDHLCRVRLCVNPAHLELVTSRENTLRGVGLPALRARQTHCIHGHEFTPENTGIRARGTRWCRTCQRDHRRRHWLRSKTEAA